MAMDVAMADPLMAAKKAQETKAIIASPPGMPLTAWDTAATMRRVMPPPFMISPANMKKNIAVRLKLSMETMNFWAKMSKSIPFNISMTIAETERANTMGTPAAKNAPNRTR